MDIYEELQKHLLNEYDDVFKYVELSKADGNSGEAQILRDIAREEFVHAEHLKKILEDANKNPLSNVEISNRFKKAETALSEV